MAPAQDLARAHLIPRRRRLAAARAHLRALAAEGGRVTARRYNQTRPRPDAPSAEPLRAALGATSWEAVLRWALGADARGIHGKSGREVIDPGPLLDAIDVVARVEGRPSRLSCVRRHLGEPGARLVANWSAGMSASLEAARRVLVGVGVSEQSAARIIERGRRARAERLAGEVRR